MAVCLFRCSLSARRLYPSTARRWNRDQQDVARVSLGLYRNHSSAVVACCASDEAACVTVHKAALQDAESSNKNGSIWDVASVSALAFAATASMVYAFPSEPSSKYGGGGDIGGGGGFGGGGGEGPYAAMAVGVQSSDRDVSFKPQHPKVEVAPSPRAAGKEKPFDVSVRAMKGGRLAMEDEYFVADGGRFVAVFDGHGGGGVSQFLKRNLYNAVCHHLREKHWENHPLAKLNSSTECSMSNVTPSVFSHAAALKAAFAQIEEHVLGDAMLNFQGSTAVAVLLHESEEGHRTLLSANVGDSRAILSRRGHAVDLTRDHKPNDESEKARILSMGETIEWDQLSKVHRVRSLSLSRAIGDQYAKPVVSGEVEINHFPVVEGDDDFILLASDGLWDVMTSEGAVSFVHERIATELSSVNIAKDDIDNYKLVLRRNMAKFVALEAIRRGSSDNVCVVMVWLSDSHRF